MDMNVRKKSLWPKVVLWLIVLAALAALVVFVFIPIYSQKDTAIGEPPVVVNYTGDGKKLTMENDALLFEMDGATTQFTLTDKSSGKVWYSNPQDRAGDPIALTTNKDFLSATLSVWYTGTNGTVELNNYTYSIMNQNYEIETLEDGAIKVKYAVGKIEKEFIMPIAITVDRYKEITGKMSKKNAKQVSSNYTLYEPSKLDSKKNKEELIALYPTITEQSLYILKADTSTANKTKIEALWQEAGYSHEDYEQDMQLVAGTKDNNGPVFNVSVIYRLDDRDMVVEVPYTEMRTDGDIPLTYVSVLPMFGAAGTQEEGYMLIPEGGGAVLRYNNGKLNQNPYYANMYGWDYASERLEAVNETRNAFPVFGMNQPDGAFICIIEGASAYGGVYADIAGRFNSYNYVYGKYNVLHFDQFNVSKRTAQQLFMFEQAIPTDTIVQRYRFLDACSYVEMAQAYGDRLAEDPDFVMTTGEDMPINVELIGAINKVETMLGVPVDHVVPVTTFQEAQAIMDELTAAGVKDLNIRMTGWANGGVRQKVLTGVHPERSLGGENGLKKLVAAAKDKGVNLYFDGITCFAYNSGLIDGFFPFSHAARMTTREQVKLYAYDIVTFQQAKWTEDNGYAYYLVRPSFAKETASNLIDFLSKDSVYGVAFRDIGNLLSADYYNRAIVTREQVKQQNIDTLKEAHEKGLKVSIKEGNDYAVPYADLITNMNLTGKQYALLDENIPFYQIALHGLKEYTGESMNLAGDYKTVLLESAEVGAGLNFTFMKTDTDVLVDTAYSCFTSAGYDRWKEEVIPMITRYQAEMTGLNRVKIVDHENLSDLLSVTTYENGTKVYVNYGTVDEKADGLTIPARDYLVKGGAAK